MLVINLLDQLINDTTWWYRDWDSKTVGLAFDVAPQIDELFGHWVEKGVSECGYLAAIKPLFGKLKS
jgi:hypothetical protein